MKQKGDWHYDDFDAAMSDLDSRSLWLGGDEIESAPFTTRFRHGIVIGLPKIGLLRFSY